jgi:hypothetical protein
VAGAGSGADPRRGGIVSYDINADLEYQVTELAAMLAGLDSDAEMAATITLEDLFSAIDQVYVVSATATDATEPDLAARSRARTLKRSQARKLIYYRDLLSWRIQQ